MDRVRGALSIARKFGYRLLFYVSFWFAESVDSVKTNRQCLGGFTHQFPGMAPQGNVIFMTVKWTGGGKKTTDEWWKFDDKDVIWPRRAGYREMNRYSGKTGI